MRRMGPTGEVLTNRSFTPLINSFEVLFLEGFQCAML
jgi:hypothetical protein